MEDEAAPSTGPPARCAVARRRARRCALRRARRDRARSQVALVRRGVQRRSRVRGSWHDLVSGDRGHRDEPVGLPRAAQAVDRGHDERRDLVAGCRRWSQRRSRPRSSSARAPASSTGRPASWRGSCSPRMQLLVAWSQQARTYALVTFAVVLASLLFVRALDDPQAAQLAPLRGRGRHSRCTATSGPASSSSPISRACPSHHSGRPLRRAGRERAAAFLVLIAMAVYLHCHRRARPARLDRPAVDRPCSAA